MKKLLISFMAAVMAAACTPSGREQVPSATISDPSGDPPGSPSGTTSDDPSESPKQGALKGWNCLTYSFGKLTFDQTIEFVYDSKGRICEYDERQIAYGNDGVTPWADENYKRFYHYASDTRLEFYDDFIGGRDPAKWYELDAEGRIKEESYTYGPNFLYTYDEGGYLVEIANMYQYEEEEDEELYDSWDKSICIEWDPECYPARLYQKWVNPDNDEVVERSSIRFLVDLSYFNPFQDMIQDPTLSGTELYSIIGLKGMHSTHLVRGWYLEEDRNVRTEVKLLFDSDGGITGVTLEGKNYGLDTKTEYTFSWTEEAPQLKADPFHQIIN